MSLRTLIILLSFSLSFACRPESDEDLEPPSYVLDEQLFVKVLTDCYLGEAAVGVNVKNVRGEQFDSAYQFNPFKDNNITKEQFDTTIAYYSEHPKKLKLIYERILANLSEIQAMGNLEGLQTGERSENAPTKPTDFVSIKSRSIPGINSIWGYKTTLPYAIQYHQ